MENVFYRFEFKYEMAPAMAMAIEDELKKSGMRLDKNVSGEKQDYCVTSLYFDSGDLSDYYDKMGGFLKRKKLRARIYEPYLKDSENVWLEMKSKHDMKVHKKRFSLSRGEWQVFLGKGASSLLRKTGEPDKENVKKEIIWNFLSKPVKPSAMVRYIRKPYVFNDLRITFDRQIEACKKNDLNYTKFVAKINNKGIVMEVKFSHLLPYWFRNIIKEYGLRRDAFSKYSHSIDGLYRHNPLPK